MTITKNKTTIAVVALIIGQIFWGTSYIFTEYALRVFPPATLVAIRMTVAAIVLGTIAAATGKLVRIPWQHFRWFFLAAACEPFIYFFFEALGIQHVGSMVSSIILAFIPLITPFLTYYFIREKITPMSLIGIVISIAGVLMVIVKKGGALAVDLPGVVFLFIAMFAAIGYALIIRKVPEEYNTLCVVFYMFSIAVLYFIPTSLIMEWDQISALITTPPDGLMMAFLAIVGLALSSSCIAFLFYSYGVRIVGPNRAAVFNNIQPAVTALFAWLFLSQDMTWVKWVGIAVVILGMFVSQRKSA